MYTLSFRGGIIEPDIRCQTEHMLRGMPICVFVAIIYDVVAVAVVVVTVVVVVAVIAVVAVDIVVPVLLWHSIWRCSRCSCRYA